MVAELVAHLKYIKFLILHIRTYWVRRFLGYRRLAGA